MQGNTLCWTDIPVIHLDRAIAFYSAVLGAEVSKQSSPEGEFGLLPHTDNVSGCLCKTDDNQPSQNGPLIYLATEGRLDAAIAATKKHGGKVLREKHQIGAYGFRAIILDCEGNRIALHSHSN